MKTYKFLLVLIALTITILGCKKDEDNSVKSERFILLTSHAWTSQTLEANGVDASGPGGILEPFVGDVIFNEDGSGTIGSETGSWSFTSNETQLTINSSALTFPVTLNIVELSETRLELTTTFNSITGNIDLRLVYLAK
jgi:hypothetical protein